ncbi:hypothetical protein EVAR_98044_1 [Eumeta japonica]|uniref:Uncharacterized protein n=1 Tax=Eumeta variegata TaxID=151549 RepID=A0A4C1WD77_EUMVA|nr:hypothetical protein EVAR_98044_1 [Eumeta japonica]
MTLGSVHGVPKRDTFAASLSAACLSPTATWSSDTLIFFVQEELARQTLFCPFWSVAAHLVNARSSASMDIQSIPSQLYPSMSSQSCCHFDYDHIHSASDLSPVLDSSLRPAFNSDFATKHSSDLKETESKCWSQNKIRAIFTGECSFL